MKVGNEMGLYYVNVNPQPNGDHEVHVSTCERLPSTENRKYLGIFTDCKPAVIEAKKYYPKADGCYYCSNPCHKR